MSFAQKLQKRRKEIGFSQEHLAFELNVSRQAVSKWESGQGYPEVEKLVQISELLDISLDELMKDRDTDAPLSVELEPQTVSEREFPELKTEPEPKLDQEREDSLIQRFVTSTDRDTVERYLNLTRRSARGISAGVAMIICGVIPTMIIDNDLGVAVMMLMIAAGVGILIKSGMQQTEIEKLKKMEFHLSGELICDLQDEYDRHQKTFTTQIVIGVFVIIAGVGVMLMLNGLFGDQDMNAAVMFPFVAIGVANFITAGMIHEVYQKLLKIED